jgi:hypothetical protein
MKLLPAAFLTSSLMLALFATTGRGQSLLVNFQAHDYTGGSTWTDTEGNATADYVGSTAAVANSGSVTTNGGFSFATGDVMGLDGLSTYTEAVGFTATSIAPQTTGAFTQYAFAGNGVFGADINGFGQGDTGLSLSSYNNGIVAGGGVQGGNDVTLYDAASPTGNFTLGTPTGAVLVVQANTAGSGNPANGSFSLYVNGTLVDQATGLNTQPFAETGGQFGAIPQSFDFGVGTMVNAYGPGFSGTLTQEQIYSGALTATAAETLSTTISADSVPEPSVWAMMFTGITILALSRRRHRI